MTVHDIITICGKDYKFITGYSVLTGTLTDVLRLNKEHKRYFNSKENSVMIICDSQTFYIQAIGSQLYYYLYERI